MLPPQLLKGVQEIRRTRAVNVEASGNGLTTQQDLIDRAGATRADHHQPSPPPSRPQPPTAESTLYSRLMYAGGIREIVHELYERVLNDPLLAPYFDGLNRNGRRAGPAQRQIGPQGIEWQWLRWHLRTFLTVLTGGPKRYMGRTLHDAHAHLHISGEAFDRLAWHLGETLAALEYVAPADRLAILEAAAGVRGMIVTGPGSPASPAG